MSLLLALFCDAKCVNVILSAGNSEGGLLSYIYIFSILILLILGLLNNGLNVKVNKPAILILFTISIYLLLTIIFVGMPNTSILVLLVQTFVAFVLPFLIQIDVRTFLYGLMIIPIPAITRVNQIFVMSNIGYDAISMGVSYAFLTPVIASIVYVFVFFKYDSILKKTMILIIVFINSIYASYLFLYGSRGPLLAILLLVLYLFIVKYDLYRNKITINIRRLVLFLFLAVIISTMLIPIFNALNDILQSKSLSFRFVDKILHMHEEGDISNGRTSIYNFTIENIFQRPIFGHGIGCFYTYYYDSNIQYPHNFILQLLYDGGIVLFLIVIIPVISNIKKWYKHSTIDKYVLISILLFSSVPRSLVSGDLWESGILWLCFGTLISPSIEFNKNNI